MPAAGKDKNRVLVVEDIQATIDRLTLRISDRFPQAGLVDVCRTLHQVALETRDTLSWIARPNRLIQVLAYTVIGGVVLATVYGLFTAGLDFGELTVSDLIKALGDVLQGATLAGAGVVFVITFETRRRRTKVIKAVNRLRCLAHIIDVHQLTKDPDAIGKDAVPTTHSPRRQLTPYELGRYLNYCSEMLALTSKLAFLYIQEFPDPVATNAVNDLEKLTTDLARKIWQKIILLDDEDEA